MIARMAINLTWAEIGIICIGCCCSFAWGWMACAVMSGIAGPPPTKDSYRGWGA